MYMLLTKRQTIYFLEEEGFFINTKRKSIAEIALCEVGSESSHINNVGSICLSSAWNLEI